MKRVHDKKTISGKKTCRTFAQIVIEVKGASGGTRDSRRKSMLLVVIREKILPKANITNDLEIG